MHRCQLEKNKVWKHSIYFQTWEKMKKKSLNIINVHETCCAYFGVSPKYVNDY